MKGKSSLRMVSGFVLKPEVFQCGDGRHLLYPINGVSIET